MPTTFGKTLGFVSSRTMASEALNIAWLVTLKAARLTWGGRSRSAKGAVVGR